LSGPTASQPAGIFVTPLARCGIALRSPLDDRRLNTPRAGRAPSLLLQAPSIHSGCVPFRLDAGDRGVYPRGKDNRLVAHCVVGQAENVAAERAQGD